MLLNVWRSLQLILILLPVASGYAQRIDYRTRDVAVELNVPWEIRWGHDDWIWFTERAGWFKRVHPETGEIRKIHYESEVYCLGERGMLGFDFHPDFPDTPFVYIVYTYGDSTTVPDTVLFIEKVVRYRYEADTLLDKTTLFDGIEAYMLHNGARVAIGPDRKLYVSTSETYYKPELSQQDESPNGKILRLNLDGSIPDDNPWKGSPVWSKGHRNPQGLFFGPDGTLYASEHGHMSDDEINIITPGKNYGWPLVEGYCDKESERQVSIDSSIVEPMVAWTPTLAVTGMDYYNYDRVPEWKNSILLTTLKDQSLWQLRLDESRTRVIAQERYKIQLSVSDTVIYAKRLRDVCFAPDGRIFVSTSNIWDGYWRPDRIFELIRTGRSYVHEERTLASKQPVRVTPNPADDRVSISGVLPGATVEAVDLLGRQVRHKITEAGQHTITFDWRPGVYYLRVTSGNKIDVFPVIIR